MARSKKTQETQEAQELKTVATRAEKKDATKNLIREILAKQTAKAGELIDGAAKLYAERFGGEDTENPNDVKGRVGSVLDVMKKDGDVTFDKGMYALKAETPVVATEEKAEKPVAKAKRAKTKKTEAEAEAAEEQPQADKPKATRKRTVKTPLPAAPLQPIAPTAPITPGVAPEPIPEDTQTEQAVKKDKTDKTDKTEKTETTAKAAPKKRTRKAKAEEVKTQETAAEPKTEQTPEVKAEQTPVEGKKEKAEQTVAQAESKPVAPMEKPEAKPTEKAEQAAKTTANASPKGTVMDMSFLFGNFKTASTDKKTAAPAKAAVQKPVTAKAAEGKAEPTKAQEEKKESAPRAQKPQEKPQGKPVQAQEKPAQTQDSPVQPRVSARVQVQNKNTRVSKKALTPDEKLQAAFLSRLRRLGGEYFEYYSVYLLEKYSRMNGRRLESLRISAGDHDGGIDGEIELTDRLGFRETIYIQSKNWDPDKGDEKLWVVGETLLQQFIGACVCRQAKEGKQHCRGIFITTSRFTPEAKRILEETSDKFVGYDGADLYEAAKECEFGLVKKNGEWALDEQLLSGEKAFFTML